MSDPSRKRLRQSSLLDSFRTTTKRLKREADVIEVVDSQDAATDEDMDPELRSKMAEAAEKRLGHPPSTEPATSSGSAQRANKTSPERRSPDKQKPSPATKKSYPLRTAPASDGNPVPSTSSGGAAWSDPSRPSDPSDPSDPSNSGDPANAWSDGSAPLFTDSEGMGDSQDSTLEYILSMASDTTFKGCAKCELLTKPDCAAKLPPLKSSPIHTVLIDVRSQTAPSPCKPYPSAYTDRWDADHVRMPCSNENLYPVDGPGGKKELQNRWSLIKSALGTHPLLSTYDIEDAILLYNSRYANKWDFSGLHALACEAMSKQELQTFLRETLPGMVKLALDLPEICTQPLPLLKHGQNHSITLSQRQAASLLANAFFCTYPRRNTRQKSSEYSSFPDINFNDLFNSKKDSRKREKLRCILEYFKRVTHEMPVGNLTFTRRCLNTSPDWSASTRPLCKLRAQTSGMIEDDGYGMLQVDFANRFLGGGALNTGLVQEEIRFMICPEMILSRLVTEVLDDNECLVMTGCERFSNYTGYSDTFKWDGPHIDPTPRDEWGRMYCEVVAIDAIRFNVTDRQYSPPMLKRELNKAFCGFCERLPREHLSAVATGNWGCGAFRGDPRLKFLIQLMALSQCGRDACYFTFGNPDLCNDIYDMYTILQSKGTAVGDLFALLTQYGRLIDTTYKNKSKRKSLFKYIMDSVMGSDVSEVETDHDSDSTLGPTQQDSIDWGANTP